MSTRLVNFCYRSIRVNRVHVMRSRMQPFWLRADGTLRCTGYGRDATAFVERAVDAQNLSVNGYPHIIHLQPGVNCTVLGDEYHIEMPCIDLEPVRTL